MRRTVDDELDVLCEGLPAVALEGPRAVGKTVTAMQRATTVYRLENETERLIAAADLDRVVSRDPPVLIDEWQRLPASWDQVRQAVDGGAPPGSFLLTGSASGAGLPTHSGAGRIVTLRMRPMSLAERGLCEPVVSLRELLTGSRPDVQGHCDARLEDYASEIVASGFPGIRTRPERLSAALLDSYIDRVVEREFEEFGAVVRKPHLLRRWMAAYAAATSTTASFEKIRDAATGGYGEKPARATAAPYRDVLERLWIIDAVPPWLPTRNRIARLSGSVKHHLADPALAARLLGVEASSLLMAAPSDPLVPKEGALFGALFESLVALSLRTYAQAAGARVAHLRTWSGDHEIDLVIERRDGRIVAVEVKLGKTADDRDVRHLDWLRGQIGDDLIDAIVVTTGNDAYRRADGTGVVPAALLGP